MPEYEEEYETEADEDSEDQGVRGVRKAQRATEAENKRLREENAQASADRRELAAMKAGLDPTDKTTAFFLKHYDGDPTADALKNAAVEAGVIPEVDPAVATNVGAHTQMAAAFNGGESTPLGTAFVGDKSMRREVPADQAPMWEEIEKAARNQDYGGIAETLRSYGHEVGDGSEAQVLPGAGSPSTAPLR